MPSNRPQPRRTPSRRPAAPAARTRAPRSGGSRRPGPAAPVTPHGFRGVLERVSLPVLTRLTRAPRWLVGALPGAMLLGGLLAPRPWGPLLLGLVALFLAWLLALAWPRLDLRARVVRLLVVAGLVVVTGIEAAGLW